MTLDRGKVAQGFEDSHSLSSFIRKHYARYCRERANLVNLFYNEFNDAKLECSKGTR